MKAVLRNESGLLVAVVCLAVLFCEGGCSFFVRSDGGLTVDANATCGEGETCTDGRLNVVALAADITELSQEAAITVDGEGSDWAGMLPLVRDPVGDSLCAGADLVAVFAARDHDFVFWRVDMDGPPLGEVEILFADTAYGEAQHQVLHRVDSVDGASVIRTAARGGEWEQEPEGDGYAAAGEVLEGRIPLHLFSSPSYALITVRAFAQGSAAACDEAAGEGAYVMW